MKQKRSEGLKNFAAGTLLSAIVLLIFYGQQIFSLHYSLDSISVLYTDMIQENLGNGRWVHYIFYSILQWLNLPIYKNLYLTQIILMITVSIIIWKVYQLFEKYSDHSNLSRFICYAAAVALFVNICYYEGWFYFPETGIGASFTTALCYIGIVLWCNGTDGKIWKSIVAAVCFFVSINAYQIYIEPIIIACTLYAVLRSDKQLKAKEVIREILLLGICFVSAVANIVILQILINGGAIAANSRTGGIDFGKIIGNTIEIIKAQIDIWWNLEGFMPAGSMMPVLIVVVMILVMYFIKNIKAPTYRLWFVLMVIGCYATIYVPLIVSGDLWMAPRTMYGLPVFIAGVLLFAAQMPEKWVKQLVSGILIVFIMTSGLQIQLIATDNIATNRIDEMECQQIAYAIAEYEKSTGQQIENLYVGYDNNRTYCYSATDDHTRYDTNIRTILSGRAVPYIFNYYTGEDWNVGFMADEKKAELFGDAEYNVLDLSQQLKFEGNEAYLLIY